MIKVAESTYFETLPNAITEYFKTGELVDLRIGFSSPPDMAVVSAKLADVPLAAEPRIINSPWPCTLQLRFYNPVSLNPGQYGIAWLLPLVAIAGLGGFAYFLYKGGEITEDFIANATKLVIPLTLIIGGLWIASSALKQRS
jgi:hypothetical protein